MRYLLSAIHDRPGNATATEMTTIDTLNEQDRAVWNPPLITEGLRLGRQHLAGNVAEIAYLTRCRDQLG